MASYNPTFKRPNNLALQRIASPPPPREYVEPLSPAKPTPIEPHFNYPAINDSVNYAVQPQNGFTSTPRARAASSVHSHGHHRTPSTIDALAEAALAVSPTFASPARRHNTQFSPPQGHSHAHPSHYNGGTSEPPHKRSRSELLPSPQVGQYASRPATSYDGWSAHQSATGSHGYDSRVEEAALLLNFRTGGWPASTATLPPPPVPSAPRPHANSFPQDAHQRAHETGVQSALLPPFNPQINRLPAPTLPSPQQTSEGTGTTTQTLHVRAYEDTDMMDAVPQYPPQLDGAIGARPQQTQVLPDAFASRPPSSDVVMSEASDTPKARKASAKGKSRLSGARKPAAEKAASKRASGRKKTPDASKAGNSRTAQDLVMQWAKQQEINMDRRKSLGDVSRASEQPHTTVRVRSTSVPREVTMQVRALSPSKQPRPKAMVTSDTVCAGCHSTRETTAGHAGELDEWISCNGCKKWFHIDCAGFQKALEVKDVDKYFCAPCESTHGKTTYVRKSTRAHASVDYAELQRGVLKTSEESVEHHYIQPIKDGTFKFDPESFPRMRPELVTREFFERSGTFTEPICIPAEWNPRPWEERKRKSNVATETADMSTEGADTLDFAEDFEYDSVADDGQDKLDMVIPEGLTVRQVCDLVGPDTPLDVIDVKTQNSGAKWNLSKWADYYEEDGDEKAIRNVISLEVSQTKLGRLLRRPKVVRDIDLQDSVWPQEEVDKGKFPKVQFYCLMSIADSYTDFHIDFGGSSVYYHILKGKKTFFFIPPKAKHLKAYEEWNESPQQNFTFLPNTTKECYRVDLSEGDTMLIPAGWIHAVWTPETSLVIGGNFLTRMTYKNQFKVVDIEKNNETPQKFRYPHFQRIMWYTAIQYLKTDPLPQAVSELFYSGQQYRREQPIWADFDGDLAENDTQSGAHNTRYYSQAEVEGLPDLVNFIFRTVMLVTGHVEGISADKMKRVNASIPKGYGEPLEVAKTFALWVAWKRGNEDPPAWAHPEAILPNSKEEGPSKKLSARALKELERKEAIAAYRIAPDRQSARQLSKMAKDAAAVAAPMTNGHALPQPAVNGASPPASNAQHIHQIPSDMTNGYHDHASPNAPPAAFMINGLGAHYMSTPKTSVLGPKRVACDACRKRRIRCKHKDMVMQVPHTSNGQSQPSLPMESSFSSSNLAPELHDNITVTPLKQREHQNFFATVMDGQREGASDGAMPNGDEFQDGEGPMPGTNAYVNANIPMAMNGVPIFGEVSKRGRSKACFECRKSKRRCIHDENGNVDPAKAAEPPVPRGSAGNKKRQAGDEGSPTQAKKKLKPEPTGGLHGVLHPTPVYQHTPPPKPPRASARPPSTTPHVSNGLRNGPQHQPQMRPSSNVRQESQPSEEQQQPPIDPSLFSMYPEPDQPANNGPYATQSHPYPTIERPQLYSRDGLPSLEQIANDVLNMDGHGHDEFQDNPLAQIQQYNQQHHTYDPQDMAPLPIGPSKTDESVDSAISMPTTEQLEQDTAPLSVEDQLRAQLLAGQADRLMDADQAMESSPATVIHHELPAASSPEEPQDEVAVPSNKSNTSPSVSKSSIDNIPLYQPPAPLAKSPEIAKRQPFANGITYNTLTSSEASHKRKRDTDSAEPAMNGHKRPRQGSSETSVPSDETEDQRLARLLQQ